MYISLEWTKVRDSKWQIIINSIRYRTLVHNNDGSQLVSNILLGCNMYAGIIGLYVCIFVCLYIGIVYYSIVICNSIITSQYQYLHYRCIYICVIITSQYQCIDIQIYSYIYKAIMQVYIERSSLNNL